MCPRAVTDVSRIAALIQQLSAFLFSGLFATQSYTVHLYLHCHPAQSTLVMPKDFSLGTLALLEDSDDGSAVIGIADVQEAVEGGGMDWGSDFALGNEEYGGG